MSSNACRDTRQTPGLGRQDAWPSLRLKARLIAELGYLGRRPRSRPMTNTISTSAATTTATVAKTTTDAGGCCRTCGKTSAPLLNRPDRRSLVQPIEAATALSLGRTGLVSGQVAAAASSGRWHGCVRPAPAAEPPPIDVRFWGGRNRLLQPVFTTAPEEVRGAQAPGERRAPGRGPVSRRASRTGDTGGLCAAAAPRAGLCPAALPPDGSAPGCLWRSRRRRERGGWFRRPGGGPARWSRR